MDVKAATKEGSWGRSFSLGVFLIFESRVLSPVVSRMKDRPLTVSVRGPILMEFVDHSTALDLSA